MLDHEALTIQAAVEVVVKRAKDGERQQGVGARYEAATNQEHAAVCWHVVTGVGALAGTDGGQQAAAVLYLASFLRMGAQMYKPVDAIEVIRDVALDSVFEFLDEQLDGRNALFGLLLKYKQRCEWFWSDRLRSFAADGLEGLKGERALAHDLYDYILSQGVDFTVEPVSAGGKVDLLLKEPEGRVLVIDAKYIPEGAPPSKMKTTLADGFHQVHRYCRDFSEPAGFLVVYLESPKRLALPLTERDGFPSVTIAGTLVYCLTITITDEPSASKAGKAAEVVITEADLKATGASDDADGDNQGDAASDRDGE